MFIDSQRLGYKIAPLGERLSGKGHQNLTGSARTFSDLETPGWTSLMKSQISEKTKRTNNDKQVEQKSAQIYEKLRREQKFEWRKQDERKMIQSRELYNKQDETIEQTRQKRVRSRKKSEVKQVKESSRWKHISVHEHLYINSKKLENKKIINRLLDQQYKKKEIFKFTPSINKKSIILAESKFSRAKQADISFSPGKHQQSVQTQVTIQKEKEDKEVARYKMLNRTFYFLSEGKTLLTNESLKNTIPKLPIPCIDAIQHIVKKIYSGDCMEWLDFLYTFNDRSVKGKQTFFSLITKWFDRMEQSIKKNHQYLQEK